MGDDGCPAVARTFRVFVSSTFADLKAERNALQERVFPRLQEFCLRHGGRFQAVDLRWGVSTEAGLDQQTITICLEEIRRCQETSPRPNFLVLLGDRYGWQPPPPQIPAEEFERILERVADPEDRALLPAWYLLDENAVPPVRYLRPRTGEWREDDTWSAVERRLRDVLEAAVRELPLERADRRPYETSATEQEIQRGALFSLQDHVFCYFRSVDFGGSDVRARQGHGLLGDFVNLTEDGVPDPVAGERLGRLKQELRRLPAGNVHDYRARWTGEAPTPVTTDHLDQLCEDVYADLLRIIREELRRLESADPIETEIAAHAAFAEERSRHFTGRRDVLERIGTYLAGQDPSPLVLFGAGGSGKSAVMARAVRDARLRFPGDVVYRFIGATPDSSTGRGLLGGLCREIARRGHGEEASVPLDFRELAQDFPQRLALASAERPLVVFLDALDQLSASDVARSMSWLPVELPPYVRLVVSTLPGETLRPLVARLPEASLHELAPLARDDAAVLLDMWLSDVGRTLRPGQRGALLRQFAVEGLPLWLRLAFEEARRWTSTDSPAALPATIPGITGTLFDRLADDANHGEVVVSYGLGYLAAAKDGLTEDELIGALSLGAGDGPVLRDFRRRAPRSPVVDTLPLIVWSRLYFDLRPYLTTRIADGTALIAFYHRQLGEAVAQRHLADDAGLARHRELAGFFAAQAGTLGRAPGIVDPGTSVAGVSTATVATLRVLSELPYQQTMGELWDDLTGTLTDLEFLSAKAARSGTIFIPDAGGTLRPTYGGVHQVRDDFALALGRIPGGPGEARRRRPVIVTAIDPGTGPFIRCPHCLTEHQILPDAPVGGDTVCPAPRCEAPLRINPFVVRAS